MPKKILYVACLLILPYLFYENKAGISQQNPLLPKNLKLFIITYMMEMLSTLY